MILERFYMWLSYKLPKRLVSMCVIRVVAKTTAGKYSNTIVPELPAMEAVQRWDRIYAIPGSGKDEFYDSNRNKKRKIQVVGILESDLNE